jgi:hypothetical protein
MYLKNMNSSTNLNANTHRGLSQLKNQILRDSSILILAYQFTQPLATYLAPTRSLATYIVPRVTEIFLFDAAIVMFFPLVFIKAFRSPQPLTKWDFQAFALAICLGALAMVGWYLSLPKVSLTEQLCCTFAGLAGMGLGCVYLAYKFISHNVFSEVAAQPISVQDQM